MECVQEFWRMNETSERFRFVRDRLDLLVERLNNNEQGPEDRTKSLRQIRVLLAEMDMLASSALEQDTTVSTPRVQAPAVQ
jgi:hypothetical protein